MAHNVSLTQALQGLLNDVAQHHFHEARQINPDSMFYQTVQYAIKKELLTAATIEDPQGKAMAGVDYLRAAQLTSGGKKFLATHSA